MSTVPYSQVMRLQTGVCTLTTGVAQPLVASQKFVRMVSIFPTAGNPAIGDVNNQFAPSLSLTPAAGKYVDLSTIYVSGSAADTVKFLYDDTFP